MSLGTETPLSGYTIFAKIGDDLVISQTEFVSFSFVIKMNEPPRGQLIILDRNGLGIHGNESGTYITFEFNHVGDRMEEKSSSMMCIIDSVEQMNDNGENLSYRIEFTAGTVEILEKINAAYTGTSSNSLQGVYNKFNAWWADSFKFKQLNGSISMTDSMTWRCISMNMWDQMRYITSKSYRENDYLFWFWDDVNDAISVSTLLNAKSQPSTYVFLENNNALGESDTVKLVKESPDATLWFFDKILRTGFVGKNKEALKPNTSVVVQDAKQKKQVCGDVRGECFEKTMDSMGNRSGNSIKHKPLSKAGPLANLNVVRPNPNNTHAMYSMADEIRARVMAGFGKRVTVTIYNNAGPPIGSRVALICMNTKAPVGAEDILDKKYSDVYIVESKAIVYNALGQDRIGRIIPVSAKMTTTITLITDNISEPGIDNVREVTERILK